MTTDPSMSELLRRIEEVVRSVERLSTTLEASYVRKEVYDARHEALRREYQQKIDDVVGDVNDLKTAKTANDAFRRQILGGVIVGLILIVAQIVLVLYRIPGGAA